MANFPHRPRRGLFVRFGFPLIALVMLTFAVISCFPKAPAKAPEPDAPPPSTVFNRQVAGIGITEPQSENIALGTNLSGIVMKVDVQVGDSVQAGTPLFSIDDRATRAALATARVQAADAKHQYQLYQNVPDKRAISSDELSRRRYASELANAKVKELETELDRLQVKAPINGTILRINVRPGEFAAAGPATNNPLVLMGDISTMHVRVEVDEADALRVQPGAKAVGRLRGYADRQADLTLVRKEYYVKPKRSLTGDGNERVDTRVQELIYSFDNTQLGTYVGQQMDVYIEGGAQQ